MLSDSTAKEDITMDEFMEKKVREVEKLALNFFKHTEHGGGGGHISDFNAHTQMLMMAEQTYLLYMMLEAIEDMKRTTDLNYRYPPLETTEPPLTTIGPPAPATPTNP